MSDLINQELDSVAESVIRTISKKIPVAGFSWQIRFRDRVSNTHSAPRKGVQKFVVDSELPLGYPGFMGRVWVRYAETCPSFGSAPFRQTLTHTGSGGFGDYSGIWTRLYSMWYKHKEILSRDFPEPQIYSWDYRFFLADWPNLEKRVEQQQLLDVLTDEDSLSFTRTHNYRWEDPVFIERDRLMFQEVSKNGESLGEVSVFQ